MNNRVTVYTVLAVTVGYLLISAVPGQVERYAVPRPVMLTGPEEGAIERGFNDTKGSLNATEAPMFGLGEEAVEGLSNELDGPISSEDRGMASYFELYTWWFIDLGVAFSVYWLARRRLS